MLLSPLKVIRNLLGIERAARPRTLADDLMDRQLDREQAGMAVATGEASGLQADFAQAVADFKAAMADGIITPDEARRINRDLAQGTRHARQHTATLQALTS